MSPKPSVKRLKTTHLDTTSIADLIDDDIVMVEIRNGHDASSGITSEAHEAETLEDEGLVIVEKSMGF
jgi:hypothetical protein